MYNEVHIVALWLGLVFAVVAITHHLLRWAGVLVASQGAMLLIGAFAFATMTRLGIPAIGSAFISGFLCAGLGLVHLYVLYAVGPLLFVLLCVGGDVFVAEFWLAIPQITGGSGGLLLPERSIVTAFVSGIICVFLAVSARLVSGGHRSFLWATIRAHGWYAGLFGVNDRRYIGLLFMMYGCIVGFGGSLVATSTGYVSPFGFHLPFTMAMVMIAAASPAPGTVTLALLSAVYVFIRTVLRYSVVASSGTAVLFDVMFPLILMVAVCIRLLTCRQSDGKESVGVDA